MMALILVIALALIFVLLLIRLFARRSKTCMKGYYYITGLVFYNFFIRYTFQSSVQMQTSSGAVLNQYSPDSDVATLQATISFIIIAIFQAFPIVFYITLVVNREHLDEP